MLPENLTDKLKGFVGSAQGHALREGHQRFEPIHILKVFMDVPTNLQQVDSFPYTFINKSAQSRCFGSLLLFGACLS